MLRAELPSPLTTYVSDFAEALQDGDEIEISETLARLRQDPGFEVAVATILSPEIYGGPSDLPDFAKVLFNAWGIGDAIRHDGILILVAMDTQEVRIALGAGYPPVWDGRAHRVIEAMMLPKLAVGDTAGAIRAGLEGVEEYILRPFDEGARIEGTEGMPDDPSDLGGLDLALFAAVILGAGGAIVWGNRHRLGDRLIGLRPCPNCGRLGLVVEEIPPPPLSDQPLIIRRSCPHCHWSTERGEAPQSGPGPEDNQADTTQTGAHGGDEGGFGGGQSSGGGASGRW